MLNSSQCANLSQGDPLPRAGTLSDREPGRAAVWSNCTLNSLGLHSPLAWEEQK